MNPNAPDDPAATPPSPGTPPELKLFVTPPTITPLVAREGHVYLCIASHAPFLRVEGLQLGSSGHYVCVAHPHAGGTTTRRHALKQTPWAEFTLREEEDLLATWKEVEAAAEKEEAPVSTMIDQLLAQVYAVRAGLVALPDVFGPDVMEILLHPAFPSFIQTWPGFMHMLSKMKPAEPA